MIYLRLYRVVLQTSSAITGVRSNDPLGEDYVPTLNLGYNADIMKSPGTKIEGVLDSKDGKETEVLDRGITFVVAGRPAPQCESGTSTDDGGDTHHEEQFVDHECCRIEDFGCKDIKDAYTVALMKI